MDGGLATTGTDNQRTDGAGMTLAQLRARRSEILYLASAYDAHNVRVFGSMVRGAADERSDIDFLVDIVTDAKGFAYFGLLEDLRRALTAVLQRDVDIVDSAGLGRLRAQILGEAVPL